MKNVIDGLIVNSGKVKFYPTLGWIFVSDNEQLKEVYDYYYSTYIDLNNVPLKATKSYEDFISWWIPHIVGMEKALYKPVEEC